MSYTIHNYKIVQLSVRGTIFNQKKQDEMTLFEC